ncbi:tetratricopeptide repeat protein [Leptolyngbya sp. AN03gr2]|uniref:tetratricopeptide repeat protein n=1 Tax=unclassified Leptolyngbya TaxID=2650499 RepID=UPI003D3147E9
MSQRQRSSKRSQPSRSTSAAVNSPQASLQRLLEQRKYRQALEEIQKLRETDPEFEVVPPEAQIWLLRGQQEFEKQDFKQADRSFRRSLELGLAGEAHYWISRCLIAQNRIDEALTLVQNAFEQKQLPKDYAICYLKLLLIKGDTEKVEQLITKQAKQFSAAQLHWTRGILALKSAQFNDAIDSFRKIKRRLAPGDLPEAWTVYTQQQMKHWDATQTILGLQRSQMFGLSLMASKVMQQPILQRLALIQQAKTGEPPFTPADLQRTEPHLKSAVAVMSIVQLLEAEDYHNAAHVLLNSQPDSKRFPELDQLRSSLLTLAGQQALVGGEPECTALFLKPLVSNTPFNPQLAVNLIAALGMTDLDQDLQRVTTQLIRWIEQDSKQHPQNWTENQVANVLARLHCKVADAWIGLGRHRAAIGELERAERIDPSSAEVLARKGIIQFGDRHYPEAIQLLTQALEGGSRFEEAYSALLECYDATHNPQAKLAARQKFGKAFGDLNPEIEIEFPAWIEALSSLRYHLFEQIIESELESGEEPDSPLIACESFMNAVTGEPNSGGRVLLNQAQAQQVWDEQLAKLSVEEKIPTLQAIALSTHLFARREKGIAALINRYTDQLVQLGAEVTDARIAALVVLSVRGTTGQKFDAALRSYLDSTTQPNTALAQLQLQVRRFGWIRTLIPNINRALEQEAQNPLLLLAKATTYPVARSEYEDYKQQGFELARRLQDAKALQAFREEQAFIELREAQSTMSNFAFLGGDEFDDTGMLEAMIRQIFGQKIPKAELDRMMPELKRRMMNELPDFADDEDDSPPIFGNPKKRKPDFRKL